MSTETEAGSLQVLCFTESLHSLQGMMGLTDLLAIPGKGRLTLKILTDIFNNRTRALVDMFIKRTYTFLYLYNIIFAEFQVGRSRDHLGIKIMSKMRVKFQNTFIKISGDNPKPSMDRYKLEPYCINAVH